MLIRVSPPLLAVAHLYTTTPIAQSWMRCVVRTWILNRFCNYLFRFSTSAENILDGRLWMRTDVVTLWCLLTERCQVGSLLHFCYFQTKHFLFVLTGEVCRVRVFKSIQLFSLVPHWFLWQCSSVCVERLACGANHIRNQSAGWQDGWFYIYHI